MPLAPNTWPLPYTASYRMVFDSENRPSYYDITITDNSTNESVSAQTSNADPLELNKTIKDLADLLYP